MLVVDIDVDVVLIVDKRDYLIVGKRDYWMCIGLMIIVTMITLIKMCTRNVKVMIDNSNPNIDKM